jgi:hypothetical protein
MQVSFETFRRSRQHGTAFATADLAAVACEPLLLLAPACINEAHEQTMIPGFIT